MSFHYVGPRDLTQDVRLGGTAGLLKALLPTESSFFLHFLKFAKGQMPFRPSVT